MAKSLYNMTARFVSCLFDMKQSITVRLTDYAHEILRKESSDQGVTRTAVIERALRAAYRKVPARG